MADLQSELNNAQSLGEMINIFSKYYDVENCKPGAIQKAAIIAGLNKIQTMTGVQPRAGMNATVKPGIDVRSIAQNLIKRRR
jgi:hypothetical protein